MPTEETSLLTHPSEPTPRQTGRVLVIDPAGRVLLLEGFDPAEPDTRYWFTIGGGLDEGEETAQAALRELREEAGIVVAADQLDGPVWQRNTEFSFDGTRYRQHEEYCLLRVGEVHVSLANLDDVERRTVTGYRWWSHQQLAPLVNCSTLPNCPTWCVSWRCVTAAAAEPALTPTCAPFR